MPECERHRETLSERSKLLHKRHGRTYRTLPANLPIVANVANAKMQTQNDGNQLQCIIMSFTMKARRHIGSEGKCMRVQFLMGKWWGVCISINHNLTLLTHWNSAKDSTALSKMVPEFKAFTFVRAMCKNVKILVSLDVPLSFWFYQRVCDQLSGKRMEKNIEISPCVVKVATLRGIIAGPNNYNKKGGQSFYCHSMAGRLKMMIKQTNMNCW